MIIAESGQADRKKERHIDWFSFKKTILIKKNKAMLYVIYRMTIIYNPNIGIVAKNIFKIEIKKKT